MSRWTFFFVLISVKSNYVGGKLFAWSFASKPQKFEEVFGVKVKSVTFSFSRIGNIEAQHEPLHASLSLSPFREKFLRTEFWWENIPFRAFPGQLAVIQYLCEI